MKLKYDTLALIGLAVILLIAVMRTREHLTVGAVNIGDGAIYKCNGTAEYGIVSDGKISAFASGAIATSYDPAWTSKAVAINCASAPRGTGISTMKGAASSPSPGSSGPSMVSTPPITTPTAPTPSTPPALPPVIPPASATAPTPATPATNTIASCNIENFAPF